MFTQEETDRFFQAMSDQAHEDYEDRKAHPENWEYLEDFGWAHRYNEEEHAKLLVRTGSFDTGEKALKWLRDSKDPESKLYKYWEEHERLLSELEAKV